MNRYRSLLLRVVALGIVLTAMTGLTIGQSSNDTLEQGFRQPPDSAKPRVWWHWMNGNISKEGIKLDLEWMHRVDWEGSRTSMPPWPRPRSWITAWHT